MIIRKLRLQRGWTQDQLAELCDVSTRTIQRLERGYQPGLETAKSLAAVFEVDVSTFLIEESDMKPESTEPAEMTSEEKTAMEYVRGVKEFYHHAFMYIIMVAVFGGVSLFGPATDKAPMIFWGAFFWGIGLVLHGLVAFEKIQLPWIGTSWEKRQIEKRLGRKL